MSYCHGFKIANCGFDFLGIMFLFPRYNDDSPERHQRYLYLFLL